MISITPGGRELSDVGLASAALRCCFFLRGGIVFAMCRSVEVEYYRRLQALKGSCS
jgi:hypothetical protein